MILLFMIKHFICDFPLQMFPYMYKNKGKYGHLGGLLHAYVHYLGTLVILVPFIGVGAFCFALSDMVAHYHIDYCKVKVCQTYNLQPDNSQVYWVLLGFDQFLHFLTYYIMIEVL